MKTLCLTEIKQNLPPPPTMLRLFFHRKLPLLLLTSLLLVTTSIDASFDTKYPHYCDGVVEESTPLSAPLSPGSFTPLLIDHSIVKLIKTTNVNHHNNTPRIYFKPHTTFKTQNPHVFKLEAKLRLTTGLRIVVFPISGFWNSSSGKLCMTSYGSGQVRVFNVGGGRVGHFEDRIAVLKLHYANSSDMYSSLINGTLESLYKDNNGKVYAERIIILGISKRSYEYKLIENEEREGVFDRFDYLANESLGSGVSTINRLIMRRQMEVEYKDDCSKVNCDFFGGGKIGKLPSGIHFRSIEDTVNGATGRLRWLLVAGYDNRWGLPLDPNVSLVSEGKWDEEKKRFDMVGCHIIGGEEGEGSIEDCSVRVSLRVPSKWTLRERYAIVGEMWSTKLVNESGYFGRVHLRTSSTSGDKIDNLTYEYTEIEKVRKSCTENMNIKGNRLRYPNALSTDMSFSMSLTDNKGKRGYGYLVPITVGNQFFHPRGFDHHQREKENVSTMVNVSFQLSFGAYANRISTIISAEGFYYPSSGRLCMIGCKRDVSTDWELGNNTASVDCNVSINVQYAPLHAKRFSGIVGAVRSTRSESDPLYFQTLQLKSHSIYELQARRSRWRMDVEIAMVLISNSLICVLVGVQLFYVNRNQDVLPNISVMMLILLNLCHLIPLLLNFEAMFFRSRSRQNVSFGTEGWVEANEVVVRVIAMVAFLLEFSLLQQTCSSRNEESEKKSLWISDKKVLFSSLPLYVCGGLIAWFVAPVSGKSLPTRIRRRIPRLHNSEAQSLWGGLKSYAGLALDGFLLPQILFNIFSNSKEKALSPVFYVGTTIVRLLPHAYDIYRNHDPTWSFSFIYVNPRTDYYSTAWDIIISVGGLVLALVIFLQQKFGGRFFLPATYRESSAYEKVPAYSNESL